MKAMRRALIALIVSLGLAVGFSPPARADAPPDPVWEWGSSFDCWQGESTVSECAYDVVLRLVGFTDDTGQCAVRAQAPTYCDGIANDERTWLWRPVTTWDIAQAVLRGYERVTQEPSIVGSGFWETYAQNLYTAAQARVASLFDPVTHEYLGQPPTMKDFSKSYAPTISGTAKVGKTLSASSRSWSPKVTGKAWQWQRNGVDITGATSYKYKLAADDLGATITVKLTGSKAGYNSVTKTSKATKIVTPGTITRGKVKITGTRRVGRALTASTSKWTSGVTFGYQWYRSGIAVQGATAKTYTLLPGDLGKRFKVKVSASKDGYYVPAPKTTKRTGTIHKGYISKVTPFISGVPQMGTVLTANPGVWKPEGGVALAYQWYRGSRAIRGATGSTYTLTTADLGKTIKVKVTGKSAGYYTTSRYSRSTAKVASPPPPPAPEPAPSPTPSVP